MKLLKQALDQEKLTQMQLEKAIAVTKIANVEETKAPQQSKISTIAAAAQPDSIATLFPATTTPGDQAMTMGEDVNHTTPG